MKRIILLVLVSFASLMKDSFAQVLTQDSKGSSSALVQGGVLGLDPGEAALGVSYNNLFDSDYYETKFVWGFSAIGKNEKGLANLLEGGHFQPEAKIDALIGFRGFNKSAKTRYDLSIAISNAQKPVNEVREKFKSEFTLELSNSVESVYRASAGSHLLDIAEARQSLVEARGKLDVDELVKFAKEEFGNSKDPLKAKGYKDVEAKLGSLYSQFLIDLAEKKKVRDQLEDKQNKDVDTFLVTRTFFLRPGLRSSSFYLHEPKDTVDLHNNFAKKFYTGFYIDAGVNFEAYGWLWAATIGMQQANSIEYQEDQKYTVKGPASSSSSGQQQTYQKEYTAYTGDYVNEWQFTFKTDAIKYFSIGKNSLAINPYFRLQSGKTLPDIQSLGLGGYFFKREGPFVLGLYLEAYDLSNNVYKYTGELTAPSFSDRLKFGLITKLTLSSILRAPLK